MKYKKNFHMIIFILAVGLAISACAPKPINETSSPLATEQPQPEAIPLENSANNNLGDCYNAYNPVEEGRVWNYKNTTGSETSDFEMSYTNITQSSFTSIQKFTDFSTEAQWTCGPDGLLSDQIVNVNLSQIPGLSIETAKVNGIVIPREDLWQVGYSWDTEFETAIKITNGDTVIEGNGNLMLANIITAVESVTVPAGVYDNALRVDITGTIKLSILGVENSIPMTYTNWFVKDTGLIKSASTDTTLPFSMELVSMEDIAQP